MIVSWEVCQILATLATLLGSERNDEFSIKLMKYARKTIKELFIFVKPILLPQTKLKKSTIHLHVIFFLGCLQMP
jgi:hypothetical protein